MVEWGEKDCSAWAKEHFGELVKDADLDDAGTAWLQELAVFDGDVLLVNSRGRVSH